MVTKRYVNARALIDDDGVAEIGLRISDVPSRLRVVINGPQDLRVLELFFVMTKDHLGG